MTLYRYEHLCVLHCYIVFWMNIIALPLKLLRGKGCANSTWANDPIFCLTTQYSSQSILLIIPNEWHRKSLHWIIKIGIIKRNCDGKIHIKHFPQMCITETHNVSHTKGQKLYKNTGRRNYRISSNTPHWSIIPRVIYNIPENIVYPSITQTRCFPSYITASASYFYKYKSHNFIYYYIYPHFYIYHYQK